MVYLQNLWPGWATSSATMLTYLFGGSAKLIAIGILVVIGAALTLAPVIYVALEPLIFLKVAVLGLFVIVAGWSPPWPVWPPRSWQSYPAGGSTDAASGLDRPRSDGGADGRVGRACRIRHEGVRRRPHRAEELVRDGVSPAPTATGAAAGADAVVLMVATPEQVEHVLFGPDAAAAALEPGATVIVMATVGPAAVERWADRLAAQAVHLVDAPVSGGVARAGAGDLTIMVGGPDDAVRRVQPLLHVMARTAPVVGSHAGDGQKVKLVNQMLCGVHIAVAAEALAFAEAMGLDARSTWEVIRDGAAASFMLDDRGTRMVDAAHDEVKSALDIFVKDMGLVTDAARASAYPAPLASATEQIYMAGRRAGLGRLDDSSIIEVLRGELNSAYAWSPGH